jgi:hypothetical protein
VARLGGMIVAGSNWIASRIGHGGSPFGASCGEICGWLGGIFSQIGASIVCGWRICGPGAVVDVGVGSGKQGLQLVGMNMSMSSPSLSLVRMWNGLLLPVSH